MTATMEKKTVRGRISVRFANSSQQRGEGESAHWICKTLGEGNGPGKTVEFNFRSQMGVESRDIDMMAG